MKAVAGVVSLLALAAVAATTRAALMNASRVQMSRGRRLRATSSITCAPAATAICSRVV